MNDDVIDSPYSTNPDASLTREHVIPLLSSPIQIYLRYHKIEECKKFGGYFVCGYYSSIIIVVR